jgi:Flp pilus assembly secretin CpaC
MMTAKGNVEVRAKGVTLHADSLVASAPDLRTAESKGPTEASFTAGEEPIQVAAASPTPIAVDSGRAPINPDKNEALRTLNVALPTILVKSKFIELPETFTNLLAKWFAPSSTSTGACTAVLSPSRTRELLAELQSKPGGSKLLNEAQLTTSSGCEAQIQIAEMKTIAVGTTNGVTQTQNVPVGPTLVVLPTAEADGHTIQMKVTPTLVEFLGYDDPGAFVIQDSHGVPLTAQIPLPHFRVRQVTLSTNVWDGHTLAIYGMPATHPAWLHDKVPVLGDLPLVGKLFRSETRTSRTTHLIVLITPTLVDAAGKRVNPEER